MLDKAAYATAMGVEKVAGGVKKGVVSAGVRVMAVPGRIERGRAKRKIEWLKGKGFVEVAREGDEEAQETDGAEGVERVRVVPRAASTAATATATAPAATGAQERPRNRTRNTNTNTDRNRHGGEWREVTGIVAERVREERRREERRREERRREERRRAARSGEERPRADRPRTERPREQRSRAQTPRQERPRQETPRQETPREQTSSEVSNACTAYWHLGGVM